MSTLRECCQRVVHHCLYLHSKGLSTISFNRGESSGRYGLPVVLLCPAVGKLSRVLVRWWRGHAGGERNDIIVCVRGTEMDFIDSNTASSARDLYLVDIALLSFTQHLQSGPSAETASCQLVY